jgi:cyclopropane-fatty-acyl-phospholipid synthase
VTEHVLESPVARSGGRLDRWLRAAVFARLDRWLRAAVFARLDRVAGGEIHLVERSGGGERRRFGTPGATLVATIRVSDSAFYRALALRGALGAAESYMDGDWQCDDLTSLVRILALDREAREQLDRWPARALRPALRLLHALRRNTRRGSRHNIAAHYDLGNDFFASFLDPTLTYSCGIFERPEATLVEASLAKYERVCRKLRLTSRDHVLEIGSGWGGFALHAAGRHGCRVTTTTISREQYDLARERVAAAGLADRVEVLFEDYRDLRGRYDKLVSIEMIEAVGHRNLGRFFRVCGERLRPDGAMLLQAITVADRDFERSRRSVDFIKRYVFPGGQLVSLGAIARSVAAETDLRITHVEEIGPHYARTLACWRQRMFENLAEIRALDLPERFLRMWEYYLCYCEGAFRERAIGASQVLLDKPLRRSDPVLGRLAG